MPLTVEAMRAAVIAIRAGAFDDQGGLDVDVGAQQAVAPSGGAVLPAGGLPRWGSPADGSVVLVLAGHAGAGASTVALAIADALAAHQPVQLIDYADPVRSGLAAASSIELGLDHAGWRHGRRGLLDIARLTQLPPGGELVPPPRNGGHDQLLVVDAGWPLTTALLHTDDPGWLISGQRVVVVTRLTVPAVRQAEHLLAALAPQTCGETSVAAIGLNRWPRAVEATCGPNLLRLRADGRAVRIPIDARLERSGLTPDPLPRSVASAGRALAAMLVPSGQLPGPRHAVSSSSAGPEAHR